MVEFGIGYTRFPAPRDDETVFLQSAACMRAESRATALCSVPLTPRDAAGTAVESCGKSQLKHNTTEDEIMAWAIMIPNKLTESIIIVALTDVLWKVVYLFNKNIQIVISKESRNVHAFGV